MKRVLITGAGGFVCRHIAEAFANAGDQVYALDQCFDADLLQSWQGRITCIQADAGDLPDIIFDVFVHGAAITGTPASSPLGAFRENLDCALQAMEWAVDHAIRALFISSSGVYDQTEPGPVDENAAARPVGMYAVAKYTIERLVATATHENDVQWAAIRLSNIYGPGESIRPSRPFLSIVGRMVHEALTTGQINVPAYEAARDWTFAPDIGEAVHALAAAQRWTHSLYNVASEQRFTADEIAARIVEFIPTVALIRVTERPAERAALTRLGYLSNARFTDATHFHSWTPFAEGVRATVAWMREQVTL